MDLNKYFRYSWYLHIIFFILRSVSLVLESISTVMGDDISAGTKNVYSIVADLFSAVRQFAGISALCLVLVGFMKLLHKLDKERLRRRCCKYAYFLFIIGVLLILNDIAGMIISLIAPWTENSLTAENLPVIIIYSISNLLIAIISMSSAFISPSFHFASAYLFLSALSLAALVPM